MVAAAELLEWASLITDEEIDAERCRRSLRRFVGAAWPVIEPTTPFVAGPHIDAICAHLEAVSRGEVRNLLITIPPRMSKPVDAEALILTADGSRKRLADVVVGDEVVTHRGRARRVLAIHEQGALPVVRVVTKSNRAVRAAVDHPFLTPEGWVNAARLVPGQAVANLARREVRASADHRDAAFRLAGYFVGDGSLTQNNCGITCYDDIEGRDIVACAEAMGFGWSVNAKRQYRLKGGARTWTAEAGLRGKSSHTKRVPAWVFTAPDAQVAQFIGAYFACDGTLQQRTDKLYGGKRPDLTITFTSVNRALLQDVQHLLLRFGVRSAVREHAAKPGQTFFDDVHTSYKLTISGRDDTAKFAQLIPMHSVKAERLAAWSPKRQDFDRPLLPDIVKSVNPDGTARCRCLTVAEDETFTANDIVVHNSTLVSVMWPAWEWARDPSKRFLTSSYAADLAIRDAVKTRRLLMSPWYQTRWGDRFRMSGDVNLKSRYENDRTGYRIATSVGGAGTGEGGDIVTVDDPHSVTEANSPAMREAALRWWDETMSTRLNDPKRSARVIIQQRIHEEDLAGHVMAQGGYCHLNLAMEFEGDRTPTCLGWTDWRTEPGELLIPERFGLAERADALLRLGPVAYAGQYQQRPAPAEGGILKRHLWRRYTRAELPLRFRRVAAFADTAHKKGKANDYTAVALWGEADDGWYLLALVWEKCEFPELLLLAQDAWARWRLLPPGRRPTQFVVEDASSGTALIQTLAKQSRIPIVAYRPDGDKEARVNAVSGYQAAGKLALPATPGDALEPFDVEDFVAEHAVFPNGTHDDRVDTTTEMLLFWEIAPPKRIGVPSVIAQGRASGWQPGRRR